MVNWTRLMTRKETVKYHPRRRKHNPSTGYVPKLLCCKLVVTCAS